MTDEEAVGPGDRARWYDLDVADLDDDLALYGALADRMAGVGPVLELAVGTGRLAVPLAASGHRVTGVDLDPEMLERAREAWEVRAGQSAPGGDLELIAGDMTTLALDRRFGLVIVAFNALLMLSRRDRQADCLRVVARHLAPGGRAVIDVWVPSPDDLAVYDGRLLVDWIRLDPATGRHVAKMTTARYDPATAAAQLTTIFDSWPAGGGATRRMVREDELLLIGATELVQLAQAAGLFVERIAGDYDLGDFGPESDRIVLVCGLL